MTDRLVTDGLDDACRGLILVLGGALSIPLNVAFKRATYKIARAETDCQSERQDNTAKKYAKRQFYDIPTNLKVVQYHRGRQHKYKPFDAQRKESRILQLRIHSS